ncbi:hypothetical protein [Brevibacillus sp. SIMBA_040]|uniref:hypothetical protein n=1 Tax=unclassified Brevibacillus TaxID=2684853 RepID=UPI00397AFA73
MTHNQETVLVALYSTYKKEVDLQRVYSAFAKVGKVDSLIKALIQMQRMGLVTIPSNAWAYGGPWPEDIVMSAVKLTDYGKQRAEMLEREVRERLK